MSDFSARVYIARTDNLNNKAVFEKLYRTVLKSRREKIDRLVSPDDKLLSLAAGLLLEKGLSDLGIDGYEITLGENGKPQLKGGGVFFNLSHSGNTAMCALSYAEIGCDVEKIAKERMNVAKRYFTPAEYKRLLKAQGDEQRQLFFRLWTLKESFIKALGGGLSVPLNSFEMCLDGEKVSVSQSVDNRKFYFKEYCFDDGYSYSVCSLSPNFGEAEFVTLN